MKVPQNILKSCLTLQQLTAYATGDASADEAQHIASHLDCCDQCCVQLSQLVETGKPTPDTSIAGQTASISRIEPLLRAQPAYEYWLGQVPDSAARTQPVCIGRYRVDKELGAGGFGIVYAAYDEQLDRKVAIKTPRIKPLSRHAQLSLIQSEAKTVANLDHPNIVPIYDVGSTPEFPVYLVTKLIEGDNLAIRIGQGVAEPVAIGWMIQIAQALSYAHGKGVIHRDIKPQNILIDQSDSALLTDFGLAWRSTDSRLENITAGTPAYMSPEQRSGSHQVDHRSDIYALGRVLWELLENGDEHSSLDRTTTAHTTRTDLRATGRDELAAILERALAEDPAQRFQSAQEFAQQLQDYASGQGFHPDATLAKVNPIKQTRAASATNTQVKVTSLAVAGIILAFVVSYWILEPRRLEANNLRSYLAASPGELEVRLKFLKPPTEQAFEQLTVASQSADPDTRAKAWLAMLAFRPKLAQDVAVLMAGARDTWRESLFSALLVRPDLVKEQLLSLIRDPARSAYCRLNAASFLCRAGAAESLTADPAIEQALMATQLANSGISDGLLTDLQPLRASFIKQLRQQVLQLDDREGAEAVHLVEVWGKLVGTDVFLSIDRLIECPIDVVDQIIPTLHDKPEAVPRLRAVVNCAGESPDDPFVLKQYRAQLMAAYALVRLGYPEDFWALWIHRPIPDMEYEFIKVCDESPAILSLIANQLTNSDMLAPLTTSAHNSQELLFSPELSRRRLLIDALFRTPQWTRLEATPLNKIIERLRRLVIEDADPGMQALAHRTLQGLTPVDQWALRPWFSLSEVKSSHSDRSWSVNGLGMVMVHIEKPEKLDHDYCISQMEIQTEAFELFLRETAYPWNVKPDAAPGDQHQRGLMPQNHVNWYDCAAFCNWLSRREGLAECYQPNSANEYAAGMSLKPDAMRLNGYRLPQDAEWQFACRAGSVASFATGHFESLATNLAWTSRNTLTPQCTGIVPPNALGLFDMHGNLSEWILNDPARKDISQPVQDETTQLCRGGNFLSTPNETAVHHSTPHRAHERLPTLGFRIARTIE